MTVVEKDQVIALLERLDGEKRTGSRPLHGVPATGPCCPGCGHGSAR